MRHIGICLALLFTLFVGGCSNRAMDDFDRNPAAHGLLNELQTASMKDPTSNGYQVKVTSVDNGPATNHDTTLTLQVLNSSGQPVTKFTQDMTKWMHVIVVSRDLSAFAHLHPDYQGNGTFVVHHQFPFEGDFQLITEFIPDEMDITVCKQWITVKGLPHQNQVLKAAPSFAETINGVKVMLTATPDVHEIKAGQMVMLNFHLVDAKTEQPLQHLQPFLGTSGHCVILDGTGTRYLHVHAMENMSGGSDVMFHTQFPSTGLYKVWGQFQVDGNVITAPFVVDIH